MADFPLSEDERVSMRDRCNICGKTFDSINCRSVSVRCNIRKFADEVFQVWRCPDCQCIHCLDVVELSEYYRGYGTQDQRLDFFSRRAYANMLKRFQGIGLQKHHRLLDYGCGSGNLVSFFHEKGYSEAVGFDPYGTPERFGDDRVLKKDGIDFICLQDVIEHVEEPELLFGQLFDLLKPNGVLLVGTPSADDIDLDRVHKHLHQLHAPYHLHLYTRESLVNLGKLSGLNPIAFHRRFYAETPIFGMNEAFCRRYLEHLDDNIDSLVEPPRIDVILRSPSLLFHGAFGYWYSPRHSITIVFQKTA